MKKMDATNPPAGGPTDLGGTETDGEATSGTVGSTYRATLVERDNKAQTRNQSVAGRTPMLAKDVPSRTKSSRNTGRS